MCVVLCVMMFEDVIVRYEVMKVVVIVMVWDVVVRVCEEVMCV